MVVRPSPTIGVARPKRSTEVYRPVAGAETLASAAVRRSGFARVFRPFPVAVRRSLRCRLRWWQSAAIGSLPGRFLWH